MATPRWLSSLTKVVASNPEANIYQLTTVDPNNLPQARSVVHRDILKSDPNLPLLLTTTDVRTPKVQDILHTSTVHICWWIPGSRDQFRISGAAYIIPPPSHAEIKFDPTKGLALEHVTETLLKDIGWEEKRKDVFESMGQHMKASWCCPIPGTYLEGGYDETKKWPTSVPKWSELKTDEERKNYNTAFENFTLVLIEPVYVDWVELGISPNRRTKFRRNGKEWSEEVVVP